MVVEVKAYWALLSPGIVEVEDGGEEEEGRRVDDGGETVDFMMESRETGDGLTTDGVADAAFAFAFL